MAERAEQEDADSLQMQVRAGLDHEPPTSRSELLAFGSKLPASIGERPACDAYPNIDEQGQEGNGVEEDQVVGEDGADAQGMAGAGEPTSSEEGLQEESIMEEVTSHVVDLEQHIEVPEPGDQREQAQQPEGGKSGERPSGEADTQSGKCKASEGRWEEGAHWWRVFSSNCISPRVEKLLADEVCSTIHHYIGGDDGPSTNLEHALAFEALSLWYLYKHAKAYKAQQKKFET